MAGGLVLDYAGAAERLRFDIPAQDLAEALTVYAGETGMAALVDGELAAGQRSTPVRGTLTAEDALQVLLSGTGLAAHYVNNRTAFVLAPRATEAEAAASATETAKARPAKPPAYFAALRDALVRTLCRYEETRPGGYRAAFQVWIDSGGSVTALHLLGSTGESTRDTTLSEVLGSATVPAPPAALQQPVTVVLSARPADVAQCRDSGERR